MNQPLISIIIPSYNQGMYLNKAINSVLNQTYQHYEIIVIDDGSTDSTREVVSEFSNVKYIYQRNAGVSSARNNGIPFSKGEYLLFLDGDDWLYPEALAIQLSYFEKYPDISFISGCHMKVFVNDNKLSKNSGEEIFDNNFVRLLQYNYIAHPAAVLFRRELFDKYSFDINNKLCQDYDIYLSIAKNHKILHHSQFVSAYRLHSTNISSNYAYMLKEILAMLKKHKVFLTSKDEQKAYKEGRQLAIAFNTKALYWDKLRKYKIKATHEESAVLIKYTPSLYFKYIFNYFLKR